MLIVGVDREDAATVGGSADLDVVFADQGERSVREYQSFLDRSDGGGWVVTDADRYPLGGG